MKNSLEEKNGIKVEMSFYKRLKISVTKFEDYFLIAAENWKRSIVYLIKLILIISFLLSTITTTKMFFDLKPVKDYVMQSLPYFKIANNKFMVNNNEEIVIDVMKNTNLYIILDNNTDVNKYISNDEYKDKNLIIFLEDQLYYYDGIGDTYKYSYDDILQRLNISSFSKDSLIELLNNSKITLIILIVMIITIFITNLIKALIEALLVAFVGRLASIIMGIPLKYSALFSMGCSCVTLSIIIGFIYEIIYLFTGFIIQNFEILYTIIAYIYMITAIIMLRTNYINSKNEYNKDEDRKEMENSNE